MAASSVGAQPSARRDPLEVIASVTLSEPDSLYLGAPTFFAAVSDAFLVADGSAGRVVRYDRRGMPVGVIGRKGRGPGEFVAPGAMAVVSDSVIAVHDAGQRAFELFERRTGRFVRLVRVEGVPTAVVSSGDTVFVGVVNMRADRRTGLAAWTLRDDSARYFSPVPAEYVRSRMLASALPLATFARWSGGMVVGYAGHPDLFLTDANGVPRDTVTIPAIRRRGVPRDLVERYERPQTSAQEAARNSVITALHRLATGEIVAVHLDYTVSGQTVTAAGFVSVVDLARRRACVDLPLALGDDARPLVAFRGDTLLVFEQRVGAGERAVSRIRAYRIDVSACDWVGLGRR